VLVATTARGVCALLLGDEACAEGLQARFPAAPLREQPRALAPLLRPAPATALQAWRVAQREG
jgi:hypothetical protein